MSRIRVTQKKSIISEPAGVRRIIEALGLKGIRKSKVHNDNNCVRGMINKVIHLVEYELIADSKGKS